MADPVQIRGVALGAAIGTLAVLAAAFGLVMVGDEHFVTRREYQLTQQNQAQQLATIQAQLSTLLAGMQRNETGSGLRRQR